MLSKKSFLADDKIFQPPLVGPMLGNVREHIESLQNDHRPSYSLQRLAATETTKTSEVRMLNREVGFALNNGHRQPALLGPFRAMNGYRGRSL
jgi:hypothetical protein